MKKLVMAVCLAGVTLSLSACGPKHLYAWGNYEQSMYDYTRDVEKQAAFQDTLQKVIQDNEANGKKVPPGIYAEFGYQMLEMGRTADAVKYFKMEQTEWPESKGFMNTMIAYATGGGTVKDSAEKAASKAADKQASLATEQTEAVQ